MKVAHAVQLAAHGNWKKKFNRGFEARTSYYYRYVSIKKKNVKKYKTSRGYACA